MHVPPGRGACGRGMEAIEGASGEIDVHDQFDQSSKNFELAAPGLFFFQRKGKSRRRFPPQEKKKGVPVKILTGLVELVVEMDSARFHLVVIPVMC